MNNGDPDIHPIIKLITMKILLTGANGYIGTRLLPVLLEQGHEIVCMVRDPRRFALESDFGEKVQIITGDLLNPESLGLTSHQVNLRYVRNEATLIYSTNAFLAKMQFNAFRSFK